MNPRENEAVKSVKRGGGLLRKNIFIFAFFLLLSFIFWYLNSLGKDLETEVKFPVKYKNVPAGRTLAAGMPSRVYITIKGTGYSILKMKISGNTSPLAIDFSKVGYRHLQNGRSGDYYITAPSLLQNFNQQIKSNCKIISVKPDTLYFAFR